MLEHQSLQIQNFESQEQAQPEKKTKEKPEPTPTEKLLMEIKESNDRTAEAVKEEINGLKSTVAKSEERMIEQISGIRETIESNAREFRSEISRIDKRIDQGQTLTNNLIETALKAEREKWGQRMERMELIVTNIQENQQNKEVPTDQGNEVPIIQEASQRPDPQTTERAKPKVNQEKIEIPTMTFTRGAQRQTTVNENASASKQHHPEILANENQKPDKFLNKDHERKWEIDDCKRKIIIKITVGDFIREIEDYSPEMSEDYVLKNPVNYGASVSGVKMKIYNATGIPPHKLDILRVLISTKRAKLAWVTFSQAKTVNDIFRLAVINGNSTEFNAFPHVHAKAMAHRDGIEYLLKRLQRENNSLRYQIRLGKDDLEIMLKNHKDFHYVPYRKVTLEMIDPNNEVPEWDLISKDEPKDDPKENENGKRQASQSPVGKPSAKKFVNDWKISEFIWSFLEGTQTATNYEEEDIPWEIEINEDLTDEKDDEEQEKPEEIQENVDEEQ